MTSNTERVDLLISHVADGEATTAEWAELEALAQAQPRLWHDLAEAQRDAIALRGAMRSAGDVADRVALPNAAESGGHQPAGEHDLDIRTFQHPQLRINRFGAWTGWLVAALVAIVASLQLHQLQGSSNNSGSNASILPSALTLDKANPDQLRDAWLTKGQQEGSVVGEVPGKMLVESHALPGGKGYEVICVRQVIERTLVPDLYQINGIDERGQPTLKPFRQPVRKTM